jgi:hypothetical protein
MLKEKKYQKLDLSVAMLNSDFILIQTFVFGDFVIQFSVIIMLASLH